MATTNIPVYISPFQGSEAGVTGRDFGTVLYDTATLANSISMQATQYMSFINDGYTILTVNTKAVAPTLTISAVTDNAGRSVNISHALTATQVRTFGPFRPIWWNFGGVINISFDVAVLTDVTICAVSFKI